MPTPPLLVSGVTMTADEFVAVNFRLWRQQRSTRRAFWLLGTALAVLALSVILDVMQNGRLTRTSTLAFLAMGAAYGLLRAWLVQYQLRRGYFQNPGLPRPTDFTLNPHALRSNSPSGSFEASWHTLRRAVWVQPNWLLLYPTETACYYLDLRRIQAPGTPEQVLALVRKAGIPVVEV